MITAGLVYLTVKKPQNTLRAAQAREADKEGEGGAGRVDVLAAERR